VQAFKRGFNEIFPIASLQPFLPGAHEELDLLICGASCTGAGEAEWTNADEQAKFLQPDHGYTRSSSQYGYFLKYMAEMPRESRSSFLKWLTGSRRLPIGGFAALQPQMTVVKRVVNSDADNHLPTVMACVNYVKIPAYSSYVVFKAKFDLAVAEGQASFSLT
jgi:E3 ubiquitin-protein ligase TRIP12